MKLHSAAAPVEQGFILICEKCGKKLNDSAELSRNLQKQLKEKSKDDLGKNVVRPIVTGCMNVCPKDEIAVAVVRLGSETEFFTVENPTSGRDVNELWDELKSLFPR